MTDRNPLFVEVVRRESVKVIYMGEVWKSVMANPS